MPDIPLLPESPIMESPRGEIVFALAKGVALVVACAAFLFLSVIMIVAKAVLQGVIAKYGLVCVTMSFLAVVSGSMMHLGKLNLLTRIYTRSAA